MAFKKETAHGENGHRVSYDLILALLSTVILSSLLTVCIIYLYLNHNSNINLIQTSKAYLAHLENSLEDPVWTLNKRTISQICDPYMNTELVVKLKIIDVSDDTVLYERQAPGGGKQMEVEGHVRHNDKDIAHIQMGFSKSIAEKEIFSTLRAIVILIAIIVMVIIVVSILSIRYLLQAPLKVLLLGIENIASGMYDYRFKAIRHVEFRAITKKFEQMARRIKNREASLQKSEKQYRMVFENMTDVFYRLDQKGTILEASPSVLLLYNYDSIDEIIGRNAKDFFYNIEDSKIFIEELQRKKYLTNYLIKHKQKDGTQLFVETNTKMIFDGDGNPAGEVGVFRDVTDRMAAEEALRESEEKYRSMLASMDDAIYIVSQDFHIEYMNPAMIKRIGYDATGEDCYKVIYELDKRCPWCASDKDMRGKSIDQEIVSSKDNKTYHIYSSFIFHTDGTASKLTVSRDITESKKMEAFLQQTHKMESIGTLAGGIAHDFNNILAAVIGYTEIAMSDLPEESNAQKELCQVLKAGHRAKELVQQILAFSRKSDQEMRPLRIQLIIKEVLKLIRSSLPSTIKIKQNIDQNCKNIFGDSTQIHQVLMNLCTNAYHAMRETGGVLGVSLQQIELTRRDLGETIDLKPGPYLKLEINDTGSGIPKDVRDKIFEPYFTTKKKGEGTGLGLAVVHGIIKSLHGEISVHSEVGQGTAFHVYFPVSETEEETNQEKNTKPVPTGNERILFVDDEQNIGQAYKNMIASLGYKVTVLTSSIEALNTFQTAPDSFDLIITDMTMPDMTGVELTKQIFKIRPDMPIILHTGYSDLINSDQAKAMGISDFILKPVLLRDLASRIRKVLDEE